MSVAEKMGFSSPPNKLIHFFHRSRNGWKTKCKAAKAENKSLKIRLAKMTERRDRWKAKAQSAESCPEVDSRPDKARPKNRGQ